jgi:hypothetical protein
MVDSSIPYLINLVCKLYYFMIWHKRSWDQLPYDLKRVIKIKYYRNGVFYIERYYYKYKIICLNRNNYKVYRKLKLGSVLDSDFYVR